MRSTVELQGGRRRQKLRTRNALIAAARELIARGLSPTVEDAATAADVSRTTAYRYFRDQAELLAAAHPETSRASLLPADPPSEPAKRLDVAVTELLQIVVDTEPQGRTMLRLSLDPDRPKRSLPLRQGRAIPWLEEALAPLAGMLSPARRRSLALAIRSAVGIEAFVWLVDIGGLSRQEALKTMRWSAQAMLQAAMAEAKPSRR